MTDWRLLSSYMWTTESIEVVTNDDIKGEDSEDEKQTWYSVLIITLYVILMVAIVVGNTLVVSAIMLYRSMWTVTNVFIFSCACADLLVGFFVIPATISVSFQNSDKVGAFQCKFLPYAQLLSVTASIISMAVICLERYNCIVATHGKNWNMHKALRIMLLIWLTSGLYAARQFIQEQIATDHIRELEEEREEFLETTDVSVHHTVPKKPQLICSLFIEDEFTDVYFRILDLLVIFVIPMIMMVGLYSKIIMKLREANVAASASSNKLKRRIVQMFIVVIACFFLCWLPWHMADIVGDVMEMVKGHPDQEDEEDEEDEEDFSPASITTIIALSNSCMSPIIYYIYSPLFRKKMLGLLKCECFRRTQNQVHPFAATSAVGMTHTSGENNKSQANSSHRSNDMKHIEQCDG